MEEVVSIFESQGRSHLHTTRSWEFTRNLEGLTSASQRHFMRHKAKYGRDVIVGMLDSGKNFGLIISIRVNYRPPVILECYSQKIY